MKRLLDDPNIPSACLGNLLQNRLRERGRHLGGLVSRNGQPVCVVGSVNADCQRPSETTLKSGVRHVQSPGRASKRHNYLMSPDMEPIEQVPEISLASRLINKVLEVVDKQDIGAAPFMAIRLRHLTAVDLARMQ